MEVRRATVRIPCMAVARLDDDIRVLIKENFALHRRARRGDTVPNHVEGGHHHCCPYQTCRDKNACVSTACALSSRTVIG